MRLVAQLGEHLSIKWFMLVDLTAIISRETECHWFESNPTAFRSVAQWLECILRNHVRD